MQKARLASGWQQNIGGPSKDAESQDAKSNDEDDLGTEQLGAKSVHRIGHRFIFVEGVCDLF